MSFLVRKIERTRWAKTKSDQPGARIMADLVANCIKPNGSGLSVWFAADEGSVEMAKLAVLAAQNKLDTTDIVVLPLDEIEQAGLNVIASIPKVGPETLKPLHRDIADLDLESLGTVARIVQRHLAAGLDSRLTRAKCKEMLELAIGSHQFSRDELHADISKYLASSS